MILGFFWLFKSSRADWIRALWSIIWWFEVGGWILKKLAVTAVTCKWRSRGDLRYLPWLHEHVGYPSACGTAVAVLLTPRTRFLQSMPEITGPVSWCKGLWEGMSCCLRLRLLIHLAISLACRRVSCSCLNSLCASNHGIGTGILGGGHVPRPNACIHRNWVYSPLQESPDLTSYSHPLFASTIQYRERPRPSGQSIANHETIWPRTGGQPDPLPNEISFWLTLGARAVAKVINKTHSYIAAPTYWRCGARCQVCSHASIPSPNIARRGHSALFCLDFMPSLPLFLWCWDALLPGHADICSLKYNLVPQALQPAASQPYRKPCRIRTHVDPNIITSLRPIYHRTSFPRIFIRRLFLSVKS